MSKSERMQHPWEKVSAFLSTRVLGELVPHELLAVISGVDYPSRRYYGVVAEAFRDQRKKSGRCFRLVMGRGYRVLLPTEHRDLAADFAERGKDKLTTGAEILTQTDFSALTSAERMQHIRGAAAMTALAEVAGETSNGLRLVRAPNRVSADALKQASQTLRDIKRQIEQFERQIGVTPEMRKALYLERDKARQAVRAAKHP